MLIIIYIFEIHAVSRILTMIQVQTLYGIARGKFEIDDENNPEKKKDEFAAIAGSCVRCI